MSRARSFAFYVVIFMSALPGLWTLAMFGYTKTDIFYDGAFPVLADEYQVSSKRECEVVNTSSKFCHKFGPFYYKKFPAFDVTRAFCREGNAVVEGVLNVAENVDKSRVTLYFYKEGFFYGQPSWVSNLGPQAGAVELPQGFQTWGPWVLNKGCTGEFKEWAVRVRHSLSDGKFATTQKGPFSLPTL